MTNARGVKTSYWYNKLPPSHLRIGVSRGTPRAMGKGSYRTYRSLAPGPWFSSTSPAEYKALYFDLLAKLDPGTVVDDLLKLAGDRMPVLVCFERPHGDAWCHRALISAWLKDTIDLDVPELGYESEGVGWAHPMMPPPRMPEEIWKLQRRKSPVVTPSVTPTRKR